MLKPAVSRIADVVNEFLENAIDTRKTSSIIHSVVSSSSDLRATVAIGL